MTSYSENIKNNVEAIGRGEVVFKNPFMSFREPSLIAQSLAKEFPDIPADELKAAVDAGWAERGSQ